MEGVFDEQMIYIYIYKIMYIYIHTLLDIKYTVAVLS